MLVTFPMSMPSSRVLVQTTEVGREASFTLCSASPLNLAGEVPVVGKELIRHVLGIAELSELVRELLDPLTAVGEDQIVAASHSLEQITGQAAVVTFVGIHGIGRPGYRRRSLVASELYSQLAPIPLSFDQYDIRSRSGAQSLRGETHVAKRRRERDPRDSSADRELDAIQ